MTHKYHFSLFVDKIICHCPAIGRHSLVLLFIKITFLLPRWTWTRIVSMGVQLRKMSSAYSFNIKCYQLVLHGSSVRLISVPVILSGQVENVEASERSMCVYQYCEWLNIHGVRIFVVFVKGQIHGFQNPQNSNFLYEVWRKILWHRILNV